MFPEIETVRRVLLVVIAAMVLGGCSRLPPYNFSVSNIDPSHSPLDAEVKSLTVQFGQANEQTGPIDLYFIDDNAQDVILAWRTSLKKALARAEIFLDGGFRKVSIAVKVLMLDAPRIGFDMTTKVMARYEVISRDDGSTIYAKTLTSTGVVPMRWNFAGDIRRRESINRAIQSNIALFFQEVKSIDVPLPVYAFLGHTCCVGNEMQEIPS